MLSTRKTIVAALMCALGASAVLVGCKDQAPQQAAARQMPPTEVTFITAKAEDRVLETVLSGRTNAFYEAEVRPQVNGILQKRLFQEGAEVKVGDQLYQIDDSVYVASLRSAEASLAQAQATLVRAAADARRSRELVKVNAVSKQTDDAAQAAYKAAKASVKAGEAAVASAKINLDYTKVRSPISGRVSRSEFTEGALMAAYQATPLTRVQQLDPIYVDVTQDADQILRIQRDMASGRLRSDEAGSAKVVLEFTDGTVYAHEGKLTFTDVKVNESTGSVNLRAVFPNPDRLLMPGLYVRAKLIEGVRPSGVVVPMQTLMRDAKGEGYLYLVTADNKIEKRAVKATRTIGANWLIDEGLKGGERVVYEGFQRVRPGAQVAPKEANLETSVQNTGSPLFH